MGWAENFLTSLGDYLVSEGALSTPFYAHDLWQTPIEQQFYISLSLACDLRVSWFEIGRTLPEENTELRVEPQKEVLDWKVDYVFTVKSEYGPVSQLAVECDGHDFHERTKEQAAKDRSRDRRLQDAGLTVYRFTGSEIYRNSFGCARQVLKWAEKAAWLRPGE